MTNNLSYWTFEIETSNYKKNTKSSHFFAEMTIIFDKNTLVIYYYFFKIKSVCIDTLTTKSWFSKNSTFLKRQNLFNLLKIKQNVREHSSQHSLVCFTEKNNPNEIKIINDFIDKNIHNITIKGLKSLFSGNNPAGEVSNPASAPIVLSNPEKNFNKNFAIFFENYCLKKTFKQRDVINFKTLITKKLITKENYFLKILNNEDFQELNNFIFHLGRTKEKEFGKKIVKKIREFVNIDQINKLVLYERRQYIQKVENIKVFDVFSNSSTSQKCHIFPVYAIRNKMIQKSIENRYKDNETRMREIIKISKNISNKDNYLNLDPTWHTFFDKNYFSYDENKGTIILVNNKIMEQEIQKYEMIFKKIQQIPPQHLNSQRKKFLKWRNKELQI
ncbi:hypothetical protein N8G13_00240 [Mycoplasma zalophi]|uniref:MAG4270 family putative restriction endonuclease n=1 Tax=Mycoplasma zalophi TaxID=191287 RepID=UPI0021C60090|nr:hypothetical protein [Mycoplasma zalophi]MCU4116898.1 hypothetical protein [Mycoplasma zalophi]